MTFTEPGPSVTPPKKKRALPFKRTASRKKSADDGAASKDDENDIEFFRRSKDVFPLALEEVAGSVKEENGIKASPPPDIHESKRRKVSPDSDSDSIGPVRRDSTPPPSSDKKGKGVLLWDDSDDDLIMDVKGKGKEIIRTDRIMTPKKPAPATPSKMHVLLLSDDDDDDDDGDWRALASSKKPNPRPASRGNPSARENSAVLIIDDDDDDFDLKIERKPKFEDDWESEIKELKKVEEQPDEFSDWIAKAKELEVKNQDVIVNVLVSSRLPGSVPLIVRRKLGQGLKLVLDTWVDHQRSNNRHVTDDIASLFLTWKGNKVYSHSTAASLGVQVDANGALVGNDGDGFRKGGLLLEVWTEELYTAYLKEMKRERARKLGLDDDDDGEVFASDTGRDLTPPSAEEKRKRKGIKVNLKAKEIEPFPTTIYDDTTVKMLVDQFRRERNLHPSQEHVSLYVEGERLEDDSLVKDADLDPDEMNQIEVHIK